MSTPLTVMRELDLAKKALQPKLLRLPPVPKVIELRINVMEDAGGDPALDITVILAEETTDAEREWKNLSPIERQIRDRLYAEELELWPVFRYVKESELHPSSRRASR